MRAYRSYYKFAALMAMACMALAALWLYDLWSGKRIPASGGANITVRLEDTARYQQNDPRWSAAHMGKPTGDTLGRAGCTVTSVAMALTNLGQPLDPGQLNAALTAENGFTGPSWLVWDALPRVTRGAVRVEVHREPSQEKLDACLARGDYPIVKFRIGGVIPHWVVLVGKENGTYYMRDPLIDEPNPVPLTRRTPVIYSVRCIGKVSPPPAPQITADQSGSKLTRSLGHLASHCLAATRS